MVYASSHLPLCDAYITFMLLANTFDILFSVNKLTFLFSSPFKNQVLIQWNFFFLFCAVEMLNLSISVSLLQTVFLVVIFS